MKKIHLLLIFIVLGCFQKATAQSKEEQKLLRPNLAIKFSPLSLIDYTPAFQFGVEIGTAEYQSLQIDYGYIKSLQEFADVFSGFKLKGEYRFYKPTKSPSRLKFAGIQYMYKQVLVPTTSFVWRNNNTFQELLSYKILNQTNSLFAVYGWVFKISNRFGLEMSYGLGYRRFKLALEDVPDDVDVFLRNSPWSFFRPSELGVTNTLGTFLSFRVIWRIF